MDDPAPDVTPTAKTSLERLNSEWSKVSDGPLARHVPFVHDTAAATLSELLFDTPEYAGVVRAVVDSKITNQNRIVDIGTGTTSDALERYWEEASQLFGVGIRLVCRQNSDGSELESVLQYGNESGTVHEVGFDGKRFTLPGSGE